MITLMLEQCLCWLLMYAGLRGWSRCLETRFLDGISSASLRMLVSLFAVVAVYILFLQIYHLVFPVNEWSLIPWALGLVLYLVNGVREDFEFVKSNPVVLFIVSALALWLANRALSPLLTFDTGLYHLHYLNWIQAFSIVPGLGNLKPHLAFNNSSFLLTAAMDHLPLGLTAMRGFTNFFILCVLVSIFRAVLDYWKKREMMDLYVASFAPFMLYLSVYSIGMSSDSFYGMLVIPVMGLFIHMLVYRSGKSLWPVFCLLVLLLPTIKLSALIFAVSILCVLAIVLYLRPEFDAFKGVVIFSGLAILLNGVWAFRGHLQSGYPLFPSTVIYIDSDWRVPAEIAEEEVWGVKSFARNPNVNRSEVQGMNWVRPWLRDGLFGREGVWLVVVPSLLVVSTLILGRKQFSTLLILLPIGTAVLYWLVMAPAPRFLSSTLWAGVAALLTMCSFRKEFIRKLLMGAIMAFTFVAFLAVWIIKPESLYTSVSAYRGYEEFPKIPFKIESLDGKDFYVPTDQGDRRAQVWNLPLLSGYGVPAGLELRDVNDLSEGFRTNRDK